MFGFRAWASSRRRLAQAAERRLEEPVGAPPAGDACAAGARRAECLSALAALCGRDDVELKTVLAEIVRLLPTGVPGDQPAPCRLQLGEASYWSPGYRNPETALERPLTLGEEAVGSIVIGCPSGDSDLGELVDAAADIISRMLLRREDRERLERQEVEIERRHRSLERMRRLAGLGEWELDLAAAEFSWSDRGREIARLDEAGESGSQRRKHIESVLLDAAAEAFPTRKPIDHVLPLVDGGKTRWLHAVGEIEVVDARPGRAFGIVRDITREKETEIRLSRLANHDQLTGLANRRQLLDRLDAALRANGGAGALLLIDLDDFKDVNDTDGHDIGDALLKAFARRLEGLVQKPSLVARLGGDEFVILLPNNAERSVVKRWASSLLQRAGDSLSFAGYSKSIRLSAGLTMFPADGAGSADLLKNADLAVYAAKAAGGGTVVGYDPRFRDESLKRLQVCAEVKDGLVGNQFVPHYQPKVCLATGELVGFEALLRWNHPAGIRTPGAILPAFQVPELSRALCTRMLERIVYDLAGWQARGVPFGRVALNASAAEFNGFDLANQILGRLGTFDLSPSCLGLEVTETVFLDGSTDSISAMLKPLHDAGIEIALDDFGTGYASLTHLREYPVDVIKIDQSFIRRLTTDPASQAITSVVLGLGRSLGMKVVAEGVETAEQAACLRAGGCDQVQGYFFARPMPATAVPGFIASWPREIDALRLSAAG
jgi:diguanylate cyclase (GGDEF)-like protein